MAPKNHGTAWTGTDDTQLKGWQHMTDVWIAHQLDRTPRAVQLRRDFLRVAPEPERVDGGWSGDNYPDPPVTRANWPPRAKWPQFSSCCDPPFDHNEYLAYGSAPLNPLPHPKQEKSMANPNNTNTPVTTTPEIGLHQIAAGATVLSIITNLVSIGARRAGLSAVAVGHPYFQGIVKLAAPSVMRALAQRMPHVKSLKSVDQVLRMAQIAAVTSVAQDTIDGLFSYVAPAFEQIAGVAANAEQLSSEETW